MTQMEVGPMKCAPFDQIESAPPHMRPLLELKVEYLNAPKVEQGNLKIF